MTKPIEFLTPTGRYVGGDLFKGRDRDDEGQPYTFKSGSNQGQAYSRYNLGLAIAKNDPAWHELHTTMYQVAAAAWPHLFDAQGQCLSPTFSWKIMDGDSTVPNTKMKKPCDNEGYPGHWILWFSSTTPRPVYKKVDGKFMQCTSPEEVKRGDYIRVRGSVVTNDTPKKPGLYLNIAGVLFDWFGDAIVFGPDANAMFGDAPAPSKPVGASATPTAPTGMPAGMAPSTQQPTAPVTPAAPVQPQQPTAPVQPAPSFMQTHQTQAAPVAPTPPTEQQYRYEGQVYTESQLRGFGWTDAQIAMAEKL